MASLGTLDIGIIASAWPQASDPRFLLHQLPMQIVAVCHAKMA